MQIKNQVSRRAQLTYSIMNMDTLSKIRSKRTFKHGDVINYMLLKFLRSGEICAGEVCIDADTRFLPS